MTTPPKGIHSYNNPLASICLLAPSSPHHPPPPPTLTLLPPSQFSPLTLLPPSQFSPLTLLPPSQFSPLTLLPPSHPHQVSVGWQPTRRGDRGRRGHSPRRTRWLRYSARPRKSGKRTLSSDLLLGEVAMDTAEEFLMEFSVSLTFYIIYDAHTSTRYPSMLFRFVVHLYGSCVVC